MMVAWRSLSLSHPSYFPSVLFAVCGGFPAATTTPSIPIALACLCEFW